MGEERKKADKEWENQSIELLADLEHQQWSHWMKYMYKNSYFRAIELNGMIQEVLVIPQELRFKWERLVNTPYEKLTEEEKESDREWARKVMDLLFGG